MNRKLVRITILFISALMGWAFGFIRVPYIENNDSFWVGFFACLATLVFVVAIIRIYKNYNEIQVFEIFDSPKSGSQNQKLNENKFLISFLFISFLIAGVYIYLNNKKINEQLILANKELNNVKYDTSLERQRINISLLRDLINKLDSTEINIQNKSTLDQMVERIASLSSSFMLYKEWDMENRVSQSLSSERGLLLLSLVKTRMDTNFFNKIKENVSFQGADLRNADFHGLNLSGIDLRNANLDYANLEGINLNYANLKGVSFIGANLNNASLAGANMISAKLNWAKVNEVNLTMAKLDSANFSNATVRKSKLNNASFMHAILSNAIFYESDLNNAYFWATDLSNTNFSKTILTSAIIYSTYLGDVILNNAIIKDRWVDWLKEKNNRGVDSLLGKYRIICDSISIKDSMIYRLAPIM